METGQVIKRVRKRAKMSLKALAKIVGLSGTGLSKLEGGKIHRPSINMLVKIADTLNDMSILTHHCQACPIRQAVFIRQFPDLNNINVQPGIVANRLRKEMLEAIDALDNLSERFSDKDFQSRPDYKAVFERDMEQVIDVERGIEVLKFELIMASVHSSKDLQDVYDNQQTKCERHGHHKVEPQQESVAG